MKLFSLLRLSAWRAALVSVSPVLLLAEPAPLRAALGEDRQRAAQLFEDGNFQEAYDLFRTLLTGPEHGGSPAEEDLQRAWNCMQRLGNAGDIDAFLEEIAAAHPEDWRVLRGVAQVYREAPHYGMEVEGVFRRGRQEAGTRFLYSDARDRARALQLLNRARELAAGDPDSPDVATLLQRMVETLRDNRPYWRLQEKTDFETLPDFAGQPEHGVWDDVGTPVNAAGDPVIFEVPGSWEDAENDGARIRWLLVEIAEIHPPLAGWAEYELATSIFQNAFGVQTLASWGYLPRPVPSGESGDDRSGILALHTLEENETVCRLATGVKRFTLPAEADFIARLRLISREPGYTSHAQPALENLAGIFENRRQYAKAAEIWRETIRRFGPGNENWRSKRLAQIVDNWGRFDGTHSVAAGSEPRLGFVFRNARKASFRVRRIDAPALLDDVKAYLKSAPAQLDYEQIQIDQIGYRLIQGKADKYRGEEVASWETPLDPRPNHWDRRMEVVVPWKQAGAYWVEGVTDGGNTTSVVLWIEDTAVVEKRRIRGGIFYFVADAADGRPLPEMTLELFGFKQEAVQPRNNRGRPQYRILTRQFAEKTNADGIAAVDRRSLDHEYQWLTIATGAEGRRGFLGFHPVWHDDSQEEKFQQVRHYSITDRPVYRPGHTVRFHAWVGEARYDLGDRSPFAGREARVEIHDPMGEKVFEKTFRTDAFGGFNDDFALPQDAKLGVYQIHTFCRDTQGSAMFRVEEYKKPEFEVTVEAPADPVALGETIRARIAAKYYFGAPVTEARVRYTVTRTAAEASWFPVRPWDWLYGSGYWWFASDHSWYPGWERWGRRPPSPGHGWGWPQAPPEVILRNEVAIGADGAVEVEIDTALAKELHGDQDHRYSIEVEVVDASRRAITASGSVLVARRPFQVYVWTDRGHYTAGDEITVSLQARRLDGKAVSGPAALKLLKVTYDAAGAPSETVVAEEVVPTDPEGGLTRRFRAAAPGQYRVAAVVTDAAGRSEEGGMLFVVRGEGFDGGSFRFGDLELVVDKAEYAVGDAVELVVNTDQPNATVLLFIRPQNGGYAEPKVLRIEGKTAAVDLAIAEGDMPNFFVEGLIVREGRVVVASRQIVVPPRNRVLNVEVLPSAQTYRPGAKAAMDLRLTDAEGKPFTGSAVVTVYDRAVESISGGSNVEPIRDAFWKWVRHHMPATIHNLERGSEPLTRPGEEQMNFIGIFGASLADDLDSIAGVKAQRGGAGGMDGIVRANTAMALGAPMSAMESDRSEMLAMDGGGDPALVEPVVRKEFADTAFWVAALQTGAEGRATVSWDMPDDLTSWTVRVWAMGSGTRVGEGSAEIITSKDLLLRLQAPRFFTEGDGTVLSAVVHNYLETEKEVQVRLEWDGEALKAADGETLTRIVRIPAEGEARVDWKVDAVAEGQVVLRMLALSDEESDAVQREFPVHVHGMLRTEAWSGVVRDDEESKTVKVQVPVERRPEATRLVVRWSPSIAAALVDALPYLAEYPYGCTEQTLNRFLPAVLTAKVLGDLGIDLRDIRDKTANLNPQEIGEAGERAAQWKRWERNPVFNERLLERMVKEGAAALTSMQNADGGWGWFSGAGEQSWPHTTATVVHGLLLAQENDVAIVPGTIDRGLAWLENHQTEERKKLGNATKQIKPWKKAADNIDALVFSVLAEAGKLDADMAGLLYRDRNDLAVYSKALLGLAFDRAGREEQRDMLLRNIEQFVHTDEENQTAWLDLGNGGYWWNWYGSEFEAHAAYLKLLTRLDPKSSVASGLVKYLINNRKHASYWSSTRDTALCVEALAGWLKQSGEGRPDLEVEILVDGEPLKKARITAENLFTFDGTLVIEGAALAAGDHEITFRRSGSGPLYWNSYLTVFSKEDFLRRAGLEVKVERRYVKLIPEESEAVAAGQRGQVVDEKRLRYRRELLENGAKVVSGDLVEVELLVESKNDYEYIVIEDRKAAGFEAVDLRSGYSHEGLFSYREFRDDRAALFLRQLPRGRHSLTYRLRAEVPGDFHALPATIAAMYAPELKGNADEMTLEIADRKE
ncbi:MAG TPA: MG2 domain-containing protein [Verrucomicrobiales bacterium]|nr:MG2 domain-containing protein [Verrucomicrobiales bacterium]